MRNSLCACVLTSSDRTTESLIRTAASVTEAMRRTSHLLHQEVERSTQTVQMLDESSRLLTTTKGEVLAPLSRSLSFLLLIYIPARCAARQSQAQGGPVQAGRVAVVPARLYRPSPARFCTGCLFARRAVRDQVALVSRHYLVVVLIVRVLIVKCHPALYNECRKRRTEGEKRGSARQSGQCCGARS